MTQTINVHHTIVDGKDKLIIIAIDGDLTIGSCIVNMDTETPLLYNLFVNRENRNKGVATSIIKTVIEYCQRQRKTSICLNVIKDNKSVNLYKKLGFTVCYDYGDDSFEYMMVFSLQII